MSLVIVGSVALDNVRTPFGEVVEALGGSCAYASVSASYFARPAIVAVVGGDFPAEYRRLLERHRIDLSGLQTKPDGKTFRWRGYYQYDMNQAHTLETRLNVFADFHPVIPDALRKNPFVLLGNIDPDLQLEVLEQLVEPRLALVDTMNYWIEGKQEQLLKVIRRCHVVLLNDAEARQLCDTPNLQNAARQILKLGPQRVIIKKGEHGCLMFSNGSYFSAPAFPLEVIKDPTGAGDTFAGGFLGYLAGARRLDESTFRKAVIVGTAMASFTVEDFSLNRLAALRPSEIEKRCLQLREQTRFPRIELPHLTRKSGR
ncbi:Ribokinase [Candidatus Sumerlaea chitinivorans]|uniref:Ribokinase n=1 Tax=Sumerlaea chitinivorans TaxID=2250252 RepID=A0A2Z4Y5M8_SUMC1|nr:Ribokinase [Candidatus Sumerlaea chitinivorans]